MPSTTQLVEGQRVELSWRARDIGYGIEEDAGEYVYKGRESFGKLHFSPKPKGDDIYLFEDEIVTCTPIITDIRTYTVLVEEKVSAAYYVEADSAEAAHAAYLNGEAFDSDRETVDSNLVSVEVT